jgi:hypothetical protein
MSWIATIDDREMLDREMLDREMLDAVVRGGGAGAGRRRRGAGCPILSRP